MYDLEDRLAAIRRVLDDPPQVHVYDHAPTAPGGVWRTDLDCYEFLARHCPPGTRTLETGLGISTVLFAAWGASHTCVVGARSEADRCQEYLRARQIDDTTVRFVVGDSSRMLPALDVVEIDLFLIDGCHGFPSPILDWFYGGSRLRRGGVVVVDDVRIPQVRDFLVAPLDRDPRWVPVGGSDKWSAYRRESAGWLTEEHFAQPFHGTRRVPARRRVVGGIRTLVRGLARARR